MNNEKSNVFVYKHETNRTKNGYFEIQCQFVGPNLEELECRFPCIMQEEEISNAIRKFLNQYKEVERVIYYFKGVRYEKKRNE